MNAVKTSGGSLSCPQLAIQVGIQTLGLALFALGFFLIRQEVPHKSVCQDFALWEVPVILKGNCWSQARYERVIIVIIDALRFDFVSPFSAEEVEILTERHPKGAGYHLNKLPLVRDLLVTDPSRALLYRFEADPPTTTMQRLKGLTTGSLPTFIDFSSNFHSPSITEDNIVHQLQRQGKRVTAMGDDTWQLLFPDSFNRSFPFPSFNTRDLDTVDNGVLEHLVPEMRQGEWDVLIAHFLGVDHVGHTYGPLHPTMERKLHQMDMALRTVVDEMEAGTLLLVMGDHGMTDDGNHGGASAEETEAALFLYSKIEELVGTSPDGQPLLWEDSTEDGLLGGLQPKALQGRAVSQPVAQVDLVPTLALLLGLPIPYANLGGIMPELLYRNEPGVEGLAQSFHANSHQVHRYLDQYAALATLPEAELGQLRLQYRAAVNAHQSALAVAGGDSEGLWRACAAYRRFLRDALAMGRRVWAQYDVWLMGWGLALLTASFLYVLSVVFADDRSPSLMRNVMAALGVGTCVAFFLSSLFSAWFLAEHRCLVIPALIITSGTLTAAVTNLKRFRAASLQQTSCESAIAAVLVVLHGLSLFSNSYIEGEEKTYLFFSVTALLLLATDGEARGVQQLYWVAPALAHRMAFEQTGHGQDYSSTFSIPRTILPGLGIVAAYRMLHASRVRVLAVGAGYLLLFVYWVAGAEPDGQLFWYAALRLWVPRACYMLSVLLCLMPSGRPTEAVSTKDDRHGDSHLARRLLDLAAAASIPISLVGGPAVPLSLLCMLCEGVLLKQRLQSTFGDKSRIFSTVVLAFFVGRSYYYMTGHHNQFNRLQYSAAFVGFDEFNVFVGGLLLFVNTFGTEWLSVIMLSCLSGRTKAPRSRSEPTSADTSWYLRSAFTFLLLMSTFRTLLTAICVAIQRRHLMVWAIFAPKYVFDSLMHIVQSSFIVILSMMSSNAPTSRQKVNTD